MKKLITLIAVFWCVSLFSQDIAPVYSPQSNSLWGQFAQSPAISTYAPMPDAVYESANIIAAQINQNKKYRNQLMDWIIDLKTKTDDKSFLISINDDYIKLRDIEQNLHLEDNTTTYTWSNISWYLDKIKDDVSSNIVEVNTRIKKEAEEAPQKYYDMGIDARNNKDYSTAIQYFSQVITLKPNIETPYYQRGFCYYSVGKYQMAIQDFDKFIEIKSDYFGVYYYRGWAKYYSNNYSGALEDFNKEIELNQNDVVGYYSKGSAKSQLGDEYGAISDYSKAIELKPSFSMAYNNRGWSNFKLKKYNEALNDVNMAIELDDNNSVAYDSKQEIEFYMNNYKDCIRDATKAIALNPKLSNSFLIRGRAYYRNGNKTKACEDWSKAGELGKTEAYDYIKKYCNQ